MRMEVKRTSVMKKMCWQRKLYEEGIMGNEKSNDLEGCRGI